MPTKHYPSIEFVRQCLREEGGRLFWLNRPREHFATKRAWNSWNARWAGTEAGTLSTGNGEKESPGEPRHVVMIRRVNYLRYILVWAIYKGEWRSGLDHINRCRSDDRIGNLRPATQSQNMANSSIRKDNVSGHKGVCRYRRRWVARITFNGKRMHLGCFDTCEEASAAYREAGQKYFGEYHSCG